MKYTIFAATAALATWFTGIDVNSGQITGVGTAAAQQMGSQPWGFTPRSRSLAAQFQFQRDISPGGASSTADGMAALQQYITQYNSSSTSIGNMNQVNQNLSGGSTGSVGQSTDQTASGNQGSTATTDTTVNNTAVNVEGDGSTGQNTSGSSQNQTASESQSGEETTGQ